MEKKQQALEKLSRSTTARPELMIFDAKEWIVEQYSKLLKLISGIKEASQIERKNDELPFFQHHVVPLMQSGARSLIYLVVAFQPHYFGIPISQLTFLESSIVEVYRSISQIRDSLSNDMIKDIFKVRNLFECIEIKSKILTVENPIEYRSDPQGMKVELRDVSFRYTEESPFVIKGVNFTINPGEIISVVGYNGSGKGT